MNAARRLPLRLSGAMLAPTDNGLSLSLARGLRREAPVVERAGELEIDISEPVADCHVVRLIGELDVASAAFLAGRLVEVAGSVVVVDLSGLTFIDASGVQALLDARERIVEQGHTIELTEARGLVRRVFRILGLDHLLTEE